MTDLNGERPSALQSEDRLCVLFAEALEWIAFGNFAGWSVGPHPLNSERVDHDDFGAKMLARLDLALDLLLDHAQRGKIRIYAKATDEKWLPSAVALDPGFIAKSQYDYDTPEPTLFWLSEDGEGGESYSELYVDHAELIDAFWGRNNAPLVQVAPWTFGPRPQLDNAADPTARPRLAGKRRLRRVGAPSKYDWPKFLIEAMQRCDDGLIRNQADLERQMAEWCSEKWEVEPANSQIREWASAAYKNHLARMADNSPSPIVGLPTENSRPLDD